MPALWLSAGLLVTAGLLIATEIASLPFAILVAAAAAEVFAIWKAQSRAAFAAVVAGGVLWALKRQSGRRRAALMLGVAVFALGALWQSRSGRLHLHYSAYALALAKTGALGLGLMIAAPALFLAWFLSDRPVMAAEGPGIAALALFCSGIVTPDLFSRANLAVAAACMALSWGLSRRRR